MRVTNIAMLAAALLPLTSYAALGGAPTAAAPAPLMLRAVTPQAASAGPSQAASQATNEAASGQAASAPAKAAPFSMRQSVDANGVTIREYVLPTNVVFAVTWDGPILPNMRALLGSYFPNFVAAGSAGAHGSGPLIEGNDDFRIESAGRLGRFFGVAWVPRLVPAGVSTSDLE